MKTLPRKFYRARRSLLVCLFVLSITILAVGQPPPPPPPPSVTGWQVEVAQGQKTDATLGITNRCLEPHLFRIKEDIKYLTFQEPTDSMLIAPGVRRSLAAIFDAAGLKSQVYKDELVVECIDCKKEKASRCTQDRDKVPVQLTVTNSPAPTLPAPTGDTGPAETDLTKTENEIRAVIIEKIQREAKKFDLKLNTANLTISSSGDILMAFAPVLENGKPAGKDVDVGLFFVNSTRKTPVPSGVYKMQLAENQSESKLDKKYTASFLNNKGAMVARLPVQPFNRPAYNRVSPTFGLCLPNLDPCLIFPLGTSAFEIRWWILMNSY